MSEKVYCFRCRYRRIGLHGHDLCDAPEQEKRNYVNGSAKCSDGNHDGECQHYKPKQTKPQRRPK